MRGQWRAVNVNRRRIDGVALLCGQRYMRVGGTIETGQAPVVQSMAGQRVKQALRTSANEATVRETCQGYCCGRERRKKDEIGEARGNATCENRLRGTRLISLPSLPSSLPPPSSSPTTTTTTVSCTSSLPATTADQPAAAIGCTRRELSWSLRREADRAWTVVIPTANRRWERRIDITESISSTHCVCGPLP